MPHTRPLRVLDSPRPRGDFDTEACRKRTPGRSLRSLAFAAALFLGLSMAFTGCDSSGKTTVEGPVFVGFGYTESSFEGTWTGHLGADTVETFVTVVLEVDEEGEVVGGKDSRGEDVEGGTFTLTDPELGVFTYSVDLSDGITITGRGIIEPGGQGMQADASASGFQLGILTLGRSTTDLQVEDLEGEYSIRLYGDDLDETLRGTLRVDSDGRIQDVQIEGLEVVNGRIGIAGVYPEIDGLMNSSDEGTVSLSGIFTRTNQGAAGRYSLQGGKPFPFDMNATVDGQ